MNATGILDEFKSLVSQTSEEDDIYRFMEQNIQGATPEEADQMIFGLLEYKKGASSIDYVRLEKLKGSTSESMQAFLELMQIDETDPAFTEEGIQITLNELLNRCETFEKYMMDYPESVPIKYAYRQYYYLMTAAITGG